jgi:DNA gyrase subunit A
MGRQARGVIGIRLRADDEVVSAAAISVNLPETGEVSQEKVLEAQERCASEVELLTISENGLGKRTLLSQYRKTKRGSQGVINMSVTEKTGVVVSVHVVQLIPGDIGTDNKPLYDCDQNLQLITVSTQGMLTRMPVNQIRRISRNTQGVKVMNLKENEKLVSSHLTIANEEVEISEKDN